MELQSHLRGKGHVCTDKAVSAQGAAVAEGFLGSLMTKTGVNLAVLITMRSFCREHAHPCRNLSFMWPNLFPARNWEQRHRDGSEVLEAVGLGSELTWHCDKGYHTIPQLLGVKNAPGSAVTSAQWDAFLRGSSQNVCPWRGRDSALSEQSRSAGGKPSARGSLC